MLIVLSPAKNLDFKTQSSVSKKSIPLFLEESEAIVEKMRKMSAKKIAALMDINSRLASLNFQRFQDWKPEFNDKDAKQAILAFNGDVYTGLNAKSLNEEDLEFAQKRLLILSGLHGILRPLDLIHPYRLEMGTELGIGKNKNLYSFWKSRLADFLNETLKSEKHKVIINLASDEYSEALDRSKIDAEFIDIDFKELKGDQYQIFFVFLKRARGMMARYAIKNRITKAEELKGFDFDRYGYNDLLSNKSKWIFTR